MVRGVSRMCSCDVFREFFSVFELSCESSATRVRVAHVMRYEAAPVVPAAAQFVALARVGLRYLVVSIVVIVAVALVRVRVCACARVCVSISELIIIQICDPMAT
jgi:hypothetical protein